RSDGRGGDRDGRWDGRSDGRGGDGRTDTRGGDRDGRWDGRGGDRNDGRNDGRWDDRRDDRRDDHRGDRDGRWDGRDHRDDRDGRWNDDRGGGREWHYSRSNRNWWRGNPRFRDYSGARSGFWFAPGYGYLSYPQGYSRHSWRRGEYLPRYYFRYRVYDPYMYGARPAPPGYVWVHCDNDLVLISLATGLILDVLFDLY
ncbi:RcnB family protein, partial [Caulobacter sp. 17J65-9]|uniref:RcnB family protein n=1 Tax=Caulobacter sp. 17J65-9 TaxID=2709382 RepID=UPI001F08E2EE